MTTRTLLLAAAGATLLSLGADAALAAPITVINPGGEAYPVHPEGTPGRTVTAIPPGGLAPISETGWNATLDGIPNTSGVEAIDDNQANSGNLRLSAGATDTAAVDADDFILFQETDYVAAAGEIYTLGFFGRGFYQFDDGTNPDGPDTPDTQVSFFGYLDDNGNPVQVDPKTHTTTLGGVWTEAQPHVFTVPSGSPLIGKNLTIGFYTATPGSPDETFGPAYGGFTSVDDVTLFVGAVPEPTSLALLGLGGLALLRRRRA